jgi:hypothetical protein
MLGVRHQVDRHPRSAIELGLAAEIVPIIGIKAVGETKVVLKNKVRVVEKIHHERSVGHGEVASGLRAAAIEVLVPGIERNGEEASGLPFERMLPSLALPYGRRPSAAGDINHFLVEMPLRFEFSAGRDFTDIGVRCLTGTIEANEAAATPLQFPRRNFELFYVRDMKSADDGNALLGLPFPISIDMRRLGLIESFYAEHDLAIQAELNPNFEIRNLEVSERIFTAEARRTPRKEKCLCELCVSAVTLPLVQTGLLAPTHC